MDRLRTDGLAVRPGMGIGAVLPAPEGPLGMFSGDVTFSTGAIGPGAFEETLDARANAPAEAGGGGKRKGGCEPGLPRKGGLDAGGSPGGGAVVRNGGCEGWGGGGGGGGAAKGDVTPCNVRAPLGAPI